MSDFKMVIGFVFKLLNIELPVFGFRLSILSIFIGTFILGLFIRVIVKIFGGDD